MPPRNSWTAPKKTPPPKETNKQKQNQGVKPDTTDPTTPSGLDQSTKDSQDTPQPAPEDAYDHVVPTNPDEQNTAPDRVQTGNSQAGSNTGPTTTTDPPHSAANASSSQNDRVPPTPPPDTSRRPQDDDKTSNVPAKPSVQSAKELAAIDELLQAMKRTFNMMGTTFDVLGQQATKVAELGPAMNAKQQIAAAQVGVDNHYKRQEEKMQNVKEELRKKISDQSVKSKIQDAVSSIVEEIVKREIADRVRKELQVQITEEHRNQVSIYKKKLIEVQTSLYNSEARRHNALMRSSSLNETLKPLLRPFGPGTSTPISGLENTGGLQSAATGNPPNGVKPAKGQHLTVDTTRSGKNKESKPKSSSSSTAPGQGQNRTANVSTNADASKNPDLTEGSGGRPVLPTIITDFADPTPSPLFPKDLTALMRLSPHETRTLMEDYGLVPVHHAGMSMAREGVIPRPENEPSREDHINRFLNHIGVGIQVVASPNGKTPTTPFVTMMQN